MSEQRGGENIGQEGAHCLCEDKGMNIGQEGGLRDEE